MAFATLACCSMTAHAAYRARWIARLMKTRVGSRLSEARRADLFISQGKLYSGAMNFIRIVLAVLLGAVHSLAQAASSPDWPAYGGPQDKSHYSSLRQIDRSNVQRLQTAWQFDTHQQGDT